MTFADPTSLTKFPIWNLSCKLVINTVFRKITLHPVVQIFVEHWGGGGDWQFYPNFSLLSALGDMNFDQDLFQVSKLSEDQKKRSSPEMEHFFKY